MNLHVVLAFLLATASAGLASGALPVRTVALSNTQAPGAALGAVYSSLGGVVVNNNGQTAFLAMLSGGGATVANDGAIWSEGGGSLALISREGDQAPGADPGVSFRNFFIPPRLSDNGHTVFFSQLNVPGSFESHDGIWAHDGGATNLVARSGAQAPGTPAGVKFGPFMFGVPTPGVSDNGNIAITAGISGPGVNASNSRGIWTQTAGPLALGFRSGAQAPGLAAGVTMSGPNDFIESPTINDSGNLAFLATLSGPGVTSQNNQSLWSTATGSLQLLARTGSPAPGAPAGTTFVGFPPIAPIALNNAGQAVFQARIRESDGTFGDSVWSEGGGALHPVARSGLIAPGTAGASFESLMNPVINGAGQTAFAGTSNAGDVGIWSEGGGSLALVAKVGDSAPGTPGGVTFRSLPQFVAINGGGQVAFSGELAGAGITTANYAGIWAQDFQGALRLIVRTGDVLEVATGDFRIVSQANFVTHTGNEDGRSSGFNDQGQLAFRASFTDGSDGIFVSNLVAVPEPTAWGMGLLALVVIGSTRAGR